MADWILLNGTKIDRAAFEANHAKANNQVWEKVSLSDAPEKPCLICQGIPLGAVAYRSATDILCAPCFERFVGPSTPP